MSFFLEWFVSYALTFSLDTIKRKTLQRKLDDAVDKWASSLPESCQLISVAMYFDVRSLNPSEELLALRAIGASLDKSILPSEKMIFDALCERWTICSGNRGTQPFFKISRLEAEKLLVALAKEIETVLLQEPNLFNRFVHDEMSEIRRVAEEHRIETMHLQEQIKEMHELIKRNDQFQKRSRKTFRPIPYCVIPFFNDDERKKYALLGIFKIALFKTFKDVKYKKFTCLIHVDPEFYHYDSGKVEPGITLVCGEVEFLANCIRMVDLFLNNQEKYGQAIDTYFTNPEFTRFNLKFAIGSYGEFVPYIFEIDGVTNVYSIEMDDLRKPVPYESVSSLNSALFLISYMLNARIVVLNYDRFHDNNAMLKFICSAADNRVNLANITVNIEDYDDWDYEYDISLQSGHKW